MFEFIHKSEPFNLRQQIQILLDIASGMAFLHSKNVIHRDLKSPNILLDGTHDRCLISDFGLSRVGAPGTATMSAIGTPHWMAPEILRGERYSASADIWAFGVIIFEVK